MIVICDTSPICYLLLIDQINLLQELYSTVIIPQAVVDELKAPESPPILQNWIALPPDWLHIQPVGTFQRAGLEKQKSILAMKLSAHHWFTFGI